MSTSHGALEQGCCATGRGTDGATPPPVPDARGTHRVEQCAVPGGTFDMGDAHGDGLPADGETPVHRVTVSAFAVDAVCLNNADFAAFTDATGYRTESELLGFSAVFLPFLQAPDGDVLGRPPGTPWWGGVAAADWRHPHGRHSSLAGLDDHPVVHVSWNDAVAYCAWAGRALPTEAQWEYAARGGLAGARHPWGDELTAADGRPRANVWQGEFPAGAGVGGHATVPVGDFEPNGFGLRQTVGNVWEWCRDRFAVNTYATSAGTDPEGPSRGTNRVLRGGSFLCHASYCNRYRTAARSSNTPDSAASNVGFRTVAR